jgi:large subunit ribosomal protein L14
MISVGTVLKSSDNSGARLIKCIRIYKRKRKGAIGDTILITIKTYNPKKKLKKGELHKALIIRTKYSFKYYNNYYKFQDNAAVLLNRKGLPLGTKLFGLSLKYLRFINRKVFLLLQYIV